MNKPMPGAFPNPLLQKLHEEIADVIKSVPLAAMSGATKPLVTLAALLSDIDGRLRGLEQVIGKIIGGLIQPDAENQNGTADARSLADSGRGGLPSVRTRGAGQDQ